jgi:hypothetical protein
LNQRLEEDIISIRVLHFSTALLTASLLVRHFHHVPRRDGQFHQVSMQEEAEQKVEALTIPTGSVREFLVLGFGFKQ